MLPLRSLLSSLCRCLSVSIRSIPQPSAFPSPAACVSAVSLVVPLHLCVCVCVCVYTLCVFLFLHSYTSAISLRLSVFTSLCLIRHCAQPLRTAGLDSSANVPLCLSSRARACVFCQYNALCISLVTHYLVLLALGSFLPSSPLHLCSWETDFIALFPTSFSLHFVCHPVAVDML